MTDFSTIGHLPLAAGAGSTNVESLVTRRPHKAVARLAGVLLVLASLYSVSTAAFSANADLIVTVTPVPNEVSLSRLSDASPFNAYLALEVKVESKVQNVNNAVVFTSPVSVLGDATATAAFQSVVGAVCQAGSTFTSTSFTCNIGQLRGFETARFVVIYRTPERGTHMKFPWALTYSTPGSQGSASSGTTFSYTPDINDGTTTLTTEIDPKVSKGFITFVPPGNAADPNFVFYTGRNNGTALSEATDADKLTAKLSVPRGLNGLTTLTVDQDFGMTGLTNDTLTTNTTTITIPPPLSANGQPMLFHEKNADGSITYKPILIYLQRDSSTIKTFQGVTRAPIYYTAAPGEPVPLENVALKNCTDVSGPSPDHPVCVADRIPLTKKVASGENIGDWLFVLKALQNGVSRW